MLQPRYVRFPGTLHVTVTLVAAPLIVSEFPLTVHAELGAHATSAVAVRPLAMTGALMSLLPTTSEGVDQPLAGESAALAILLGFGDGLTVGRTLGRLVGFADSLGFDPGLASTGRLGTVCGLSGSEASGRADSVASVE